MMVHYGDYLPWVAYLTSAIAAWRFLPVTIARLVGALTRDETRHRRCMEVLRLARRDAASIQGYTSQYVQLELDLADFVDATGERQEKSP